MPTLRDRARGITARRPGLVAFLVFFLMGAAWSLATPLYGSPDEPSHVVRAVSVVHGQILGQESKQYTGGILVVRVPAFFSKAAGVGCYAFVPNASAECQ